MSNHVINYEKENGLMDENTEFLKYLKFILDLEFNVTGYHLFVTIILSNISTNAPT